MSAAKPRILCVDDEPNVVSGLKRNLMPHYDVTTQTSGAKGLEAIEKEGPFIVIMADMRMPLMDGATFLTNARAVAPDTIRMLLTGYADVESAISAVNDGQIFRFLTKPCPPETLLKAFSAAVEQHRLVDAERALLEQTVHGAIKTLTDILELANPTAFGRATRVKKYVAALAEHLALRDRWQVEVAAMMSQIGSVMLSPETLNKVYYGKPLSLEDKAQVAQIPKVLDGLLANIPRLEPVRDILSSANGLPLSARTRKKDEDETIKTGARILKVAVGFDVFEMQGNTTSAALDMLRATGECDSKLIDVFAEIHRKLEKAGVKEIPLSEVKQGMVFAEDVTAPTGAVIIPRGFEVTPSLLQAVSKFASKFAKLTVKISVKG